MKSATLFNLIVDVPFGVASGIEADEMMTEGELIYIMNRKAQK